MPLNWGRHFWWSKVLNESDQVPHRPTETVKTPYNQSVAAFEGVETSRQTWPIRFRSGQLVSEDPPQSDSVFGERVERKRQLLAVGADAGVVVDRAARHD